MLPSQEQVAERFADIKIKKTNPSNIYKIESKFGSKLYKAHRKSDDALFVIKSVKKSFLDQETS